MTTYRVAPYNPTEMVQGNTWTLSIEVLDENDAPKDLTGYTAKFQLRDKPGGTLLLGLTSSPAAGITITAATGKIDLLITSTQSAAFTFSKAECELTIYSSATPPVTTSLFRGEFTVKPRITQ